MVLYSVAWAPWVPYAAAMISVVATFALPCVSTSFAFLTTTCIFLNFSLHCSYAALHPNRLDRLSRFDLQLCFLLTSKKVVQNTDTFFLIPSMPGQGSRLHHRHWLLCQHRLPSCFQPFNRYDKITVSPTLNTQIQNHSYLITLVVFFLFLSSVSIRQRTVQLPWIQHYVFCLIYCKRLIWKYLNSVHWS